MPIKGVCSAQQLLLHGRGAAATAFDLAAAQDGQGISLAATATAAAAAAAGDLLHVCWNPAAIDGAPANIPNGWLALFRAGPSLQLAALFPEPLSPVQQQHRRQRQLQRRLLAELSDASFADLSPDRCWLCPGPLLLLQPEPQTLLALAPSADAAQWQLTELDISPSHLCQLVRAPQPWQDQANDLHPQPAAAAAAAAGPCGVLHCSLAAGRQQLQLVLALPLLAAQQPQRHGSNTEQRVLLLWLHVDTLAAGDAEAACHIACCYEAAWLGMPSCLEMQAFSSSSNSSSSGGLQDVAVGSSGGELRLLHLTQQHRQGPSSSADSWQCEAVAATSLPGAVRQIEHLPRAFAAGGVQQDVLAVMHDSSDGSSQVVSLLSHRQPGQLQVLAAVEGAAALFVPRLSALGLMCPWQQQQQQQHHPQQQVPLDLSSVLQLAAVVVLEQQQQHQHDACSSDADWAAVMRPGPAAAAGLPGPLLGLMRHQPPPAAAAAAAAVAIAAAGSGEPQGEAAAAASNELRGLEVMLAALEARWQSECLELCMLQSRFAGGARAAAAAHRQLCQLAADTLQGSSARQYCLPLSKTSAAAAMAEYQAARDIIADQQQQPGLHECCRGELLLSLQLASSSSTLTPQGLVLAASIRPALELAHTAACGDQQQQPPQQWWGPLLQVCHAELLLWHAGEMPLACQCCWQWEAVAGLLRLQATVPAALLLQLAAAAGGSSSSTGGRQMQATAMQQCSPAGDGEAYLPVAQALASAAAGAASSSISTSCSLGPAGDDALQLHAALVVTACCSRQAVVQQQFQQQRQQGCDAVVQQVLRCAELTAPATALLHLQPVAIAATQLLQHRLCGGSADVLLAAWPGEQQDNAAADGQQQQPPAADAVAATPLPHPGTGCGASALAQQQVAAAQEEVLVIADSQLSDEDMEEEPLGQEQPLGVATPDPAAAAAADSALDAPAAGLAPASALAVGVDDAGEQAPHWRQLLLLLLEDGCCSAAAEVVQQLAAVLERQLGFQTLSTQQQQQQQQPDGHNSKQESVLLVQLQWAGQGAPSSRSSSSRVIRLLAAQAQDRVVHVELQCGTAGDGDALRQLLLLGLQRLPNAGRGVSCRASPLSAAAHAGCLAVSDALTQAVALQSRVVEATLQQLQEPAVPPAVGAAAAAAAGGDTSAAADDCEQENRPPGVDIAAAAAGAAAAGCSKKRPLPSAAAAAAEAGTEGANSSPAAGDNAVLLVDGRPMGAELSQCWLACYQAVADVDLAVAQLAAACTL